MAFGVSREPRQMGKAGWQTLRAP